MCKERSTLSLMLHIVHRRQSLSVFDTYRTCANFQITSMSPRPRRNVATRLERSLWRHNSSIVKYINVLLWSHRQRKIRYCLWPWCEKMCCQTQAANWTELRTQRSLTKHPCAIVIRNLAPNIIYRIISHRRRDSSQLFSILQTGISNAFSI